MSPILLVILASIAALAAFFLLWKYRRVTGWELAAWLGVTIFLAVLGFALWILNREGGNFMGILYATGLLILALAGVSIYLGFIEFAILRILGLLRLGAISRVTYYEGLLQPFTILILSAGILFIGVTARLGFFTYNEDFKMYRDVASSFVFLFSLPVMVFAATKVIDEEIENRTMLTLMSKPVSRTQVVIGKYIGVLLLVLMSVGVLGIMAAMCGYLRYFDDMRMDFQVAQNAGEVQSLFYDNYKASMALLPALVLTFLQVGTLAAISVAISTRFGLAVNVTLVVIVYVAANMARFLGNAADLPGFLKPVMSGVAYLFPALSLLDLNQRLIFGNYNLGTEFWSPGVPSYAQIWQYVGLAALYALFYSAAALSFGVALFRTRELS